MSSHNLQTMGAKFTLVCPTISRDFETLVCNSKYFFEFLPINKICVICPKELKEEFPIEDSRFIFVDESSIIKYDSVAAILDELTGEHGRTGWYLQQFLKMSYSLICEDEYYLIWDSDTVPCRKVEMFDAFGNPFFDVKSEYNKPYFDTIKNLLGYDKVINNSFVSEHMIINTSIMKELIWVIESSTKPTGQYYEKILRAINTKDLSSSGFSEFETYGTYCAINYPKIYAYRQWKSLRSAGLFIDKQTLTPELISWCSKHYCAISFEKLDNLKFYSCLFNNKFYRLLFPSSSLQWIAKCLFVISRLTSLIDIRFKTK